MTLKSEVAELRYEVAELSCSGELRLTFTTGLGVSLSTHSSLRLPHYSSAACTPSVWRVALYHARKFVPRITPLSKHASPTMAPARNCFPQSIALLLLR